MNAFEKWFQKRFSGRPEDGAEYLYNCCVIGGRDSVVWDWLGKTGDDSYSKETFIRAANLILELRGDE